MHELCTLRPHTAVAGLYTGDNEEELVHLMGGSRFVRAEKTMLAGPGRGATPGVILHTAKPDPIRVRNGQWLVINLTTSQTTVLDDPGYRNQYEPLERCTEAVRQDACQSRHVPGCHYTDPEETPS